MYQSITWLAVILRLATLVFPSALVGLGKESDKDTIPMCQACTMFVGIPTFNSFMEHLLHIMFIVSLSTILRVEIAEGG